LEHYIRYQPSGNDLCGLYVPSKIQEFTGDDFSVAQDLCVCMLSIYYMYTRQFYGNTLLYILFLVTCAVITFFVQPTKLQTTELLECEIRALQDQLAAFIIDSMLTHCYRNDFRRRCQNINGGGNGVARI
jgi:hypothetical protein